MSNKFAGDAGDAGLGATWEPRPDSFLSVLSGGGRRPDGYSSLVSVSLCPPISFFLILTPHWLIFSPSPGLNRVFAISRSWLHLAPCRNALPSLFCLFIFLPSLKLISNLDCSHQLQCSFFSSSSFFKSGFCELSQVLLVFRLTHRF